MKTLFSQKTNKKANTLVQMKIRIRAQAAALRSQEQLDIPCELQQTIDSELFRRSNLITEFQVVGKEPGV